MTFNDKLARKRTNVFRRAVSLLLAVSMMTGSLFALSASAEETPEEETVAAVGTAQPEEQPQEMPTGTEDRDGEGLPTCSLTPDAAGVKSWD